MISSGPSSRKAKETPQVKWLKYEIAIRIVPLEVDIKGDLLGQLNNLKYADHDIKDIAKFLDFKK